MRPNTARNKDNPGKKHALEVARQSGKRFAWLGVWEKNEKAIGFYQARGFRRSGTHDFMLGEDRQTDMIMKIDLNEE